LQSVLKACFWISLKKAGEKQGLEVKADGPLSLGFAIYSKSLDFELG